MIKLAEKSLVFIVPGKVGHNDGPDRHRSKDLGPGCVENGRQGVCLGCPDALFNVVLLPWRDGGVFGRTLEGQPQPESEPDEAGTAIGIIRSIPAKGSVTYRGEP